MVGRRVAARTGASSSAHRPAATRGQMRSTTLAQRRRKCRLCAAPSPPRHRRCRGHNRRRRQHRRRQRDVDGALRFRSAPARPSSTGTPTKRRRRRGQRAWPATRTGSPATRGSSRPREVAAAPVAAPDHRRTDRIARRRRRTAQPRAPKAPTGRGGRRTHPAPASFTAPARRQRAASAWRSALCRHLQRSSRAPQHPR